LISSSSANTPPEDGVDPGLVNPIPPLLQLDRLNLWFEGYDQDNRPTRSQVLHDLSLSLAAGQTTALVGESGSGKTLAALSILRLTGSQARLTGSIRYRGRELLNLPHEEMRTIRGNRIAMIFQEPMTSLNPVYTIGNQLLEPLMLHRRLDLHAAREEAIQLLQRTGIDQAEARMSVYPHQLSGGQRQRVMIAMALACRPELLIADEPTTALDVTTQQQILALIGDLQAELGMAVLLITHDLSIVRRHAATVAVIKEGHIVEQGDADQVMRLPRHPYTRQLTQAIPESLGTSSPGEEELLNIANLSCLFRTPGRWIHPFKREKKVVAAVEQASLSVRRGSTWGIIGESGSGKTSLAMAILKLLPSSGKIVFAGADISSWRGQRLRSLRRNLQIVFQDPYSSLSPRLTVLEIVEEGLKVHAPELSAEQRCQKVMAVLDEVGLHQEMLFRYPHEFSGGQRQRLAIARAVILRPQLLILDEPTSALDITIQGQILRLLRDLQQRYQMTYLFISHDLRVVRALADHLAVMRQGRIVESGVAAEIFARPQQAYTAELLAAAFPEGILPSTI
jgi:microcin C transport system ATP-binding protein